MWKVFVIVALASGGSQQQAIGKKEYATEKECVEKFDEGLKGTALRASPFIKKMDAKHVLKSVTFECRKAS